MIQCLNCGLTDLTAQGQFEVFPDGHIECECGGKVVNFDDTEMQKTFLVSDQE